MSNSIARFQISADEDFRIQFVFVGLSLAGRTLRILVKERSSDIQRAVLTIGAGLTLDGIDTLTATVPQATAAAWAKGEFETDLHDITGGANTRLVGARTIYDLPGRLPYGVIGAKATVQWVVNKAVVTAIGGIGPSGPANTLTPGAVTTLAPGEPAAVRISGVAPNQTIEFDIPQGQPGAASTVPGPPGEDSTVPGPAGEKGWSPATAIVSDGARRVLQVVDWVGGAGTKPGTGYVGPTGLTPVIGDAIDIRGPAGTATIADGNKGDITTSAGGDAWAINTGAVGTAKLADKAVTFAKLQDIATARLLGRSTGGSGAVEALTPAEARFLLQITAAGEALILATDAATQTALLSPVVGDAGTGGVKGLVPAPAAGDGAAGRFLHADGSWKRPYLPGMFVGSKWTEYTNKTVLNVTIPYDDTKPQQTEGTQVANISITPKSASSRIRITVSGFGVTALAGDIIVAAVFRDTGPDAIGAAPSNFVSGSDIVKVFAFSFEDVPGTTAEVNYRLRVGGAGGDVYLNGIAASRRLGGVARTILSVDEISG